jgi:hypothetical protein
MRFMIGMLLVLNYQSYIGKMIWLRSPIFCKDDHICHTCYGRLREVIDSRFIGVIAAQSLGECNTQLVLRVFHTSGVAQYHDTKPGEDEMIALNEGALRVLEGPEVVKIYENEVK